MTGTSPSGRGTTRELSASAGARPSADLEHIAAIAKSVGADRDSLRIGAAIAQLLGAELHRPHLVLPSTAVS